MKKILWFICITLIYTQNNENLLNILYDDYGWKFQEITSNQSKVYIKEINGLNLNGVKISRTIDFNPQYILDIVLDINNYNKVLVSSSNVFTSIVDNKNNQIIAKQEIEVPFLTDLYYFFKFINHNESKNSADWVLDNSDLYFHSNQSDYLLTIGCGGWDYTDNSDGSFTINYRLVMNIDGYPYWLINYINYYSLVNVFNDVVSAASKK